MPNTSIYIGVFLTPESKQLLHKLSSYVPEGWKWYGEHMTIKFIGKPTMPQDFPPPYNTLATERKQTTLTVTHIGISDQAIAVRVSGVESSNRNPHITIAIPQGGKPVNSNLITAWKPIENFTLTGVIAGDGDKGLLDEMDLASDTLEPRTGRWNDQMDGKDYSEEVWAAPTVGARFGGITENINAVPKNIFKNEDGTPQIFYHATQNKNIKRLMPNTAQQLGRGIYFGSDKESISDFGDNIFAVYLPDKLIDAGSLDYHLIMNQVEEESGIDIPDNNFPLEKVNDEIKKMGYKGIIMDNDVYGGKEAMVFNENDVIYIPNQDQSTNINEGSIAKDWSVPMDTLKHMFDEEYLGWILPNNTFVRVERHIDFLSKLYPKVEMQYLYQKAYDDGLVRVLYKGRMYQIELNLNGATKTRIAYILKTVYFPYLATRTCNIILEIAGKNYELNLPEDKSIFHFFAHGDYDVLERKLLESLMKEVKKPTREVFEQDLSILKREHIGWITPNDTFVGGETHYDYLIYKYPNVAKQHKLDGDSAAQKMYETAFSEGLIRTVYDEGNGEWYRGDISIQGNDKTRITNLIEKYYYPYFITKTVSISIDILNAKEQYQFRLPEDKEAFSNFVFTGKGENLKATPVILKKLMKEIVSTFPFNIGGADATYDSWSDHPGDRNMDANQIGLGKTNFQIGEISTGDVKPNVKTPHKFVVTPKGEMIVVGDHKTYFKSLYPNMNSYSQPFKDGYIRGSYDQYATGSSHIPSLAVHGTNMNLMKSAVSAYLPILNVSGGMVAISDASSGKEYTFPLSTSSNKFRLNDFLETGKYESLWESAPVKNVISEIEYTELSQLPFIGAIEKIGGIAYQVGKTNDIIIKNIDLITLIKNITPFGIPKIKKNNKIIIYKPHNYTQLIYLWMV